MNQKKLIFCFSGQGSQFISMGKELYNNCKVFKCWMDLLNEIVQPVLRESIIDILYNSKIKERPFNKTLITHPAIFMYQYSLFQVLISKGIFPDGVLGISLGEFASAAIAEVESYEVILKMIVKQAEIFTELCHKGKMIAVLHNIEIINEIKMKFQNIDIAAINAENHFVISGSESSIIDIENYLTNKGIVSVILPVSHAFHSYYLDPASEPYIKYLAKIQLRKPSMLFISSMKGDIVSDSGTLYDDFFWKVARKKILIRDTINKLENMDSFVYLDLGPSGTLANIMKLNISPESESKIHIAISPFGYGEIESLEKTVSMFNTKNPRINF